MFKLKRLLIFKRSHIRQAIMDVIFGKKMEVPMYQNLKVKCEPVSNTNNQQVLVSVSKLKQFIWIYLFVVKV